MASLFIDRMASPLGELRLIWDVDEAIVALDYDDYDDRMQDLLRRYHGEPGRDFELRPAPAPERIARRLAAYLDGDLAEIDELRVAAAGSPFQQQVWAALRRIPCGTTTTYGDIAKAVGQPSASRAVGAANGANPVAIVVPCHRVIGHNGKLTGYGGGIERKRWLLLHERAIAPEISFGTTQGLLL